MMRFILSFAILIFSTSGFARDVGLVYRNNQGVKQFKKEKQMEAYEEFLSLTAEAPYDSLLQFNIGSSLTSLGEEEKAEPLYKQLLKAIDERLKVTKDADEQKELLKVRFAVIYNLGVHYQSIKEIDKALMYYQGGLEMMPDSKEIKTNIEMMFQQGQGQGQGGDKSEKGDQQQDKGEGQQEQQQDSGADRQQNDKNQKKEFDQNQMSMEDLKRIMEELKQQEQNIRAKVQQKKGDKNDKGGKEW